MVSRSQNKPNLGTSVKTLYLSNCLTNLLQSLQLFPPQIEVLVAINRVYPRVLGVVFAIFESCFFQ